MADEPNQTSDDDDGQGQQQKQVVENVVVQTLDAFLSMLNDVTGLMLDSGGPSEVPTRTASVNGQQGGLRAQG